MTDATASLQSHYLTFLLGDDLYAIALGAVKDIRASAAAQPLHEAPAYVAGRLGHALGPMPLVDLRQRIGLPAQAGAGPAVTIVLERSGQHFAVLADSVAEVVDLGIADEPATMIAGPDARAELAWLKGAAAAGERMVLVLDPDQLIAPDDRAAVQAAMAAAATAQAA
jgi:purine-binding chemotaxis protein CheW